MARKANRGRGGGKKDQKVLMKEASAEIVDIEISMECDAELSGKDEKIEVEISKMEKQGSTSYVDALSGKGIAGVANTEMEGAGRGTT
jgi:acetolactate synthase small subunit